MVLLLRGGLRDLAQKSKPLLDILYPPLCMACGAEVNNRGLCPACFKGFDRITGTQCHSCALPLLGESDDAVYCDFCLRDTPPWDAGHAVALYDGTARRIVLALKHSDRLDLAGIMAGWMAQSARDLAHVDLVVPVPIHWRRLVMRRYNQALELARPVAQQLSCTLLPDALKRSKLTAMQKQADRAQRIAAQADSVLAHPHHGAHLAGKSILLVDDVMTTGATLRACANACWDAKCKSVNILVFARVASGA